MPFPQLLYRGSGRGRRSSLWSRDIVNAAAALATICLAAPSVAGPPYLTNDPAPTDLGRWEIYNFIAAEGLGHTVAGEGGLDLNYGAVKDVQVSATLPLGFSHDKVDGWREGAGDVEIGVKFRFYNDEASGVSIAVFPKSILPTSSLADEERIRFQIPLWFEKDFGRRTHLFGGAGYEFNPGSGNRSFAQASLALTHDWSKKVSAGVEITHQGPDTITGTTQTQAGLGTIVRFNEHYALLFSGGPTWADRRTGYHLYAALGLFF